MSTGSAHWLHPISLVNLDKGGAGENYTHDIRESFFIVVIYVSSVYIQIKI
jgi:hypothetical protein